MSSPEDLFKNAFDDYAPQPPDKVWQNINNGLRWRNFLKFNPLKFNIYYAAAAITAAGLWFNASNNQETQITINAPAKTSAEIKQLKTPTSNNNFAEKNSDNKTFEIKKSAEITPSQTITPETSTVKLELPNEQNNVNNQVDYQQIATDTNKQQPTQTINTEQSTEIVQTQKTSKGISHTKAQAEFPTIFTAVGTNSSDNVTWQFGDGTFSTGNKTRHAYKKAGTYQIKMIVKNNNSVDTITKTITVYNPEYVLTFPNALNASPSGSCDGFYNYNDRNAVVFYPRGDYNKIDKYQLIVYNRKGQEIFKTNDITIGWDGYYKGEKQPKGVYVYNAVYTFINGETYSKTGNITLMYRDR